MLHPAVPFRSRPSPRRASATRVALLFLCGACLVLCAFVPSFADPGEFLLVRRSLQVQNIQLKVIDEQTLTHFEQTRPESRVPLSDCIAIINPAPRSAVSRGGMLELADGQRLPGEPAAVAGAVEESATFGWVHPWLGRVDVAVDDIKQVQLRGSAPSTEPAARSRGRADVVVLNNGDVLEGIVSAVGREVVVDPIEAGAAPPTIVAINQVASIMMVAPRKSPTGRRVWFADGTVLDVASITVGDDGYVRLSGSALVAGTQAPRVGLDEITAVLLDPKAMLPLATLTPTRVEGPATRYVVPKPRVLEVSAPLELSPIEFRGPVVARYTLPVACTRFAASAELPPAARQWGDTELIIRSDDREVFRASLNTANPIASINVPLTGRELTIELGAGARGAIHDQVILRQAMLLKKP